MKDQHLWIELIGVGNMELNACTISIKTFYFIYGFLFAAWSLVLFTDEYFVGDKWTASHCYLVLL